MAAIPENHTDLEKLHAEVNQYINQRFLLQTLAISISGIVVGSSIPLAKDGLVSDHFSATIAAIMLITIVLLVFLGVLYFAAQIIATSVRVITSYLRVTRASPWEEAYEAFNKQCDSNCNSKDAKKWRIKWHGQLHMEGLIFSVLGTLSAAMPFVILALVAASPERGILKNLSLFHVGMGVAIVAFWLFYIALLYRFSYKEKALVSDMPEKWKHALGEAAEAGSVHSQRECKNPCDTPEISSFTRQSVPNI
jgi:hypothetical protein